MLRITLPTFALAVMLAGCAQVAPQPDSSSQPQLSYSEAQARYQQGLTSYRANRFEPALDDLTAALASGQLKSSDAIDARKYIAFIHCSNGREMQCREQFQAILKAAPNFSIPPDEANNELWGPVWRSIKGAAEEQRAVTRGSSVLATPSQQKLAEGIKDYEAGRYKEALDALQAALKGGLPARADEIRAHKYSAFSYCLTKRTRLCRAQFWQIFTLDPAFELLPSEVGHPAWASVYRSAKAAAARSAAKAKTKK